MSRDYSKVPLPYTLPAWKVPFAIDQIVQADMWRRLSYDLAVKINAAANGHHDLIVTKADLDSLPNDAWDFLRSKL